MSKPILLAGACALVIAAEVFGPAADAANSQDTDFVKVEGTVLDEVLIRPDLDLSGYFAVYLAPVEINYKSERFGVELDGEQRMKLDAILREELAQALAGDGSYGIANEPGPHVLTVRATLDDMKINVADRNARWGRNYVTSVGEVTLRATVEDGETGESLITATDRRIDPASELFIISNASYWAEAREAFSDWSQTLRGALDRHHLTTVDEGAAE